MNHFYGMTVYVDDNIGWKQSVKQVRFPRSKKKRIQNKWKKNSRNWRVSRWQAPECYVMGNQVITNSLGFAALKEKSKQ